LVRQLGSLPLLLLDAAPATISAALGSAAERQLLRQLGSLLALLLLSPEV
jgi:hypothetical protein